MTDTTATPTIIEIKGCGGEVLGTIELTSTIVPLGAVPVNVMSAIDWFDAHCYEYNVECAQMIAELIGGERTFNSALPFGKPITIGVPLCVDVLKIDFSLKIELNYQLDDSNPKYTRGGIEELAVIMYKSMLLHPVVEHLGMTEEDLAVIIAMNLVNGWGLTADGEDGTDHAVQDTVNVGGYM